MNLPFLIRPLSCVAFLAVLTLLSPSMVRAQRIDPPPGACTYEMKSVNSLNRDPARIRQLLADIANSPVCFWEIAFRDQILAKAVATAAAAEKSTATTQIGASNGSAGTTSVVSKPNTLLSLASEYGGLTSSVSNQTVTLQGTLDGVPRALATRGIKPYCWSPLVPVKECISSTTLNFLNRFGVGVTANTSSPAQNVMGTAVGTPQGTAQQASLSSGGNTLPSFSSAFAKFTVLRAAYTMPKQPPSSDTLLASAVQIKVALEQMPIPIQRYYADWQDCVVKRFSDAGFVSLSSDEKNQIFAKYYYQIVEILFNSQAPDCKDSAPIITSVPTAPSQPAPWQNTFIEAIQAYIAATSIYTANLDQSMLNALTNPVLALEYDFNAPQNQATNSTLKLVYGQSFGKPKCKATNTWTLAANVGASLYNSEPSSSIPGADLLRDIQAGAEVDRTLCTSNLPRIGSWIGDSTASFAYYYQDQTSPSILKVTPGTPLSGITIVGLPSSATQIFTQKGQINLAQFKFGFGTGKNVKFPIAVSWSNRTELIAHPTWGLQFGVSYDFSSLLGSSNSK
jgi:hypothetical protein